MDDSMRFLVGFLVVLAIAGVVIALGMYILGYIPLYLSPSAPGIIRVPETFGVHETRSWFT